MLVANFHHQARGFAGREIIEAALEDVFGCDQGAAEVVNLIETTGTCTFFMRRADGSTVGPIYIDYDRLATEGSDYQFWVSTFKRIGNVYRF